jgi:hypothetical protein
LKIAGLLALLGVDLLIIQILWPFHHRFATLPTNLAATAFVVAAVLALAFGTPRVRRLIVIVLVGLAAIGFLFMLQPGFMAPMTGSAPDPTAHPVVVAAAIVTFLVVSAAIGVRATARELRAT